MAIRRSMIGRDLVVVVVMTSVGAVSACTTGALAQVAPTSVPSSQSAQPDLSDPKLAVKSLYGAIAGGDAETVRRVLLAENESQERLISAFTDLIMAGQKFATVARDRFANAGDAIARGALTREDASGIDAAELAINGERATLQLSGQKRPLRLRRIEGLWRLAVTDFAGVTEDRLGEQTAFIQGLADAMNEVSKDITEGRYPTANDAEAAVQQKMHTLLAKTYRPATRPEDDPATRRN